MEIPTSRAVRTRIVERPGLWMPANELETLVAQLKSVVQRSLPNEELNYGVLSGDKSRLDNAIITILYDRASGTPIAFNALAVMVLPLRGQQIEVLHLGLVMVDPNFRTQGLSWILYGLTCMLFFVRRRMRPVWISNVTQVPAIVGKVTESFAQVFPSPDNSSRRSFDHLAIAREIMRRHRNVFGVGDDAEFDESRFVIKNAYTGGSDNLKKGIDEATPHRDARYNDMCRAQLDYARGDDFLQLGQFNLNVARNYLLKSVPRDSLPALLTRLLFLFIGSLLLPAIHWFFTDQALGDLRPRKRTA